MSRRTLAKGAREWYPEAIVAGLLIAIAFAGQKDDPLFAVFCALIGAIFWVLGFRHRRLPMQAQVSEILETTRRIEDIHLAGDPAEPGDPARNPLARVLPLHRDQTHT